MKEIKVGKVIHYFSRIGVAAIELEGEIKVGDTVHFKGHTTDFSQEIQSMQISNQVVDKAGKGDKVGIKVKEKVREGDMLFRVIENE